MPPFQAVVLTSTQHVSLVAASILSGRDIIGADAAALQGSILQSVDLAFRLIKQVADDNRNPDKRS